MLDDQRPADRRHQRIAVHVERVGLDGGQAVLVGELVAGIDHDGLDRAAVERPLPHHLHVLAALAEVDGDGDDLRPVSLPIQLIATEVSRPPEYARMTRSDINQSPLVECSHCRFSIVVASSAPVIGSRATTRMVSSPAMVPTT